MLVPIMERFIVLCAALYIFYIIPKYTFPDKTIEEQVYREDAPGNAVATVAAPSERQEKQ
jgi:hypothetical protein